MRTLIFQHRSMLTRLKAIAALRLHSLLTRFRGAMFVGCSCVGNGSCVNARVLWSDVDFPGSEIEVAYQRPAVFPVPGNARLCGNTLGVAAKNHSEVSARRQPFLTVDS